MFKHIFLSVGVFKGHVAKFYVAVQRLPVLALRIKAVAVLFHNLGRVGNVPYRLAQRGKPLHIHLYGNQIGKRLNRPQHGLHKPLRIGHKHRQRRHKAYPFPCGNNSAVPQNKRQRNRGRKGNKRKQQRTMMSQPFRGFFHFLSFAEKIPVKPMLHRKRFRGFRARYPLVKAARYLGIYFPHAAVQPCKFSVEVNGNNGNKRHYRNNAQRQQRVCRKHNGHRAKNIGYIPHSLIHVPRNNRGNARSIAHNPCMQLAHARPVEVPYRKRLQMIEGCAPHIP